MKRSATFVKYFDDLNKDALAPFSSVHEMHRGGGGVEGVNEINENPGHNAGRSRSNGRANT